MIESEVLESGRPGFKPPYTPMSTLYALPSALCCYSTYVLTLKVVDYLFFWLHWGLSSGLHTY
jgi:hypothetical protein